MCDGVYLDILCFSVYELGMIYTLYRHEFSRLLKHPNNPRNISAQNHLAAKMINYNSLFKIGDFCAAVNNILKQLFTFNLFHCEVLNLWIKLLLSF